MGIHSEVTMRIRCDNLSFNCDGKEYTFKGGKIKLAKDKAIKEGWSFSFRRCICPKCTKEINKLNYV